MTSSPRIRRSIWILPILLLLLVGIGVQVIFAAPGNPPVGIQAKMGAAVNPEKSHAADHVLVRLAPDATPDANFSPIFGRWYKAPVLADETPYLALGRLAALPQVEKVELDYVMRLTPTRPLGAPDRIASQAWGYEPNDPFFSEQWNFKDVLAPEAWQRGWTGAGVTVAVIDTGVWPGPDLACRSFISPTNTISDTTGMAAVLDDNGHGTHVTGTIAQCTDNAYGAAGLAYNAKIMPIKVIAKSGSGSDADVAQGIDWATTHGADVINMSLGDCPACSSTIMDDAIAAAASADILLVAAAGNDAQGLVDYPANHPDVMAVSALDANLNLTSYSSYGPSLSISAPGGDTTADLNHDGWPDGILQETRHPGDDDWHFWYYEGTSMASPHVAAAAAMLRGAYPAATATQIRAALEASALDRGAPGFDNQYGHGVLQIDDAFCQLSGAACNDIIANGGFETNDAWIMTNAEGAPYPVYTTKEAVTGDRAMYFGMNPPSPAANGIEMPEYRKKSRIYQDVAIPADVDDVFVDYWYMPCSDETPKENPSADNGDWQRFRVYDPTENPDNRTRDVIYMHTLENDCVWKHVTYKLDDSFKGHTMRFNFAVQNNSSTGKLTWMYLDDVRVTAFTYAPPTPTDTPTATPTGTPTATATDTPTPTLTPTNTPTLEPTNTPTATPTNTPTPVIAADDITIAPGVPFTMPVTMANFPAPGIGALTLDVSFDPTVITPTGCNPDPDGLFNSKFCNDSYATGVVRLTFLSTTGASGNHPLADIGFTGNGAAGASTPVTVTIQTISNPAGNSILPFVATDDGSVTLGVKKGDVNCDNQVNPVDAMFILQYEVGLRSISNQCPPPPDTLFEPACDVNGDAQCNSVDALFIMQCEVGIPNAFCPATTALAVTPLRQLQTASIMVGEGETARNGLVTIPITADVEDTAVGASTIELHFDPNALQPTACQVDPDGKFNIALCNPNFADGVVKFTMTSVGGVSGGMTLANVTFRAIGEPGISSVLNASAPTFANNTNGQAIPTHFTDGQVAIRALRIYLPITR